MEPFHSLHSSVNWSKIHFPNSVTKQNKIILHLANQFDLHPIFIYHLFINGINSEERIHDFLFPMFEKLHSPFLLNEMKVTIERILQAFKRNEEIMIFGDYDADGITAASLLAKGLRIFSNNVHVRVPNRNEGYGLSKKIMETIPSTISLIITVDNGTNANEALAIAKKKGIDVIVTDHHEVINRRPDCFSFVNPKRTDNTYPFPHLSGAGIALKVVQALYQVLGIPFKHNCTELLELATIGTIADLMPLKGENRLICWCGLRLMNEKPSNFIILLKALLRISYVDSSSIGFSIGPIFNAMGRISDPNILLELLMNNCCNPTEWKEIININVQRKELMKSQLEQAESILNEDQLLHERVIVLQGEFHAGIIGLLASKVAEKYKKPTIVINNNGTGSARSVNGTNFSIIKAIQECEYLLDRFGGHQAAAGLSIIPNQNKINLFRIMINEAAKKQPYSNPKSYYLGKLNLINYPIQFFEYFKRMEPFGISNAKPVFLSENIHTNYIKQISKEHLLLGFLRKNAFAFSKGHLYNDLLLNRTISILYTTNSYKKMDFFIKDIKL